MPGPRIRLRCLPIAPSPSHRLDCRVTAGGLTCHSGGNRAAWGRRDGSSRRGRLRLVRLLRRGGPAAPGSGLWIPGGNETRLADPANPQLLEEIADRDGEFVVRGDYLYVAENEETAGCLYVLQKPGHEVVGTLPLEASTYCEDLGLYEARAGWSEDSRYICLAIEHQWPLFWGGLLIVDVNDPRVPRIVGSLHHSDVYASTQAGCDAIDVTDPAHPLVIGSLPCGIGNDVSGEYVYLVEPSIFTNLSTLQIFPTQCDPAMAVFTRERTLVQPFTVLPNPSPGRTALQFAMARTGPLRATIHDAAGRRIRTLLDETRVAGPVVLVWNGLDEQGREVEPGIYLGRVATADGVRARRMAILRWPSALRTSCECGDRALFLTVHCTKPRPWENRPSARRPVTMVPGGLRRPSFSDGTPLRTASHRVVIGPDLAVPESPTPGGVFPVRQGLTRAGRRAPAGAPGAMRGQQPTAGLLPSWLAAHTQPACGAVTLEVAMARSVSHVALAGSVLLLGILLGITAVVVPPADALPKPAGPLGIWRSSDGPVYAAPGIPESTNVQTAFAFGDFWDMNDPSDEGHTFQEWIDLTCNQWNAERFTGVVRPPSESGVVNVPADTALYAPLWPPGMIQGAARFSRLSEIHGQIYGINIDDFGGLDTAAVHDIRDALKGKYVDTNGVVHHNTPETTPQLKLFVVIYSGHTLPAQFVPFVDGINLWIYNQNTYYQNIDAYVTQFRQAYPGKEINCGVYIMNGTYGWMTPACIDHMYRRLLDRYDNGEINGVMLFAGHWIIIPNITRARWDADALPALLDEIYYPYVGSGEGRVIDEVGAPVEGAFVTCSTIGRITGEVLVRSKKLTDANGLYRLAAWAGNRTTDATLYSVVAEKGGLVSEPVSAWITRRGQTIFPDILLRGPAGVGNEFAAGGDDRGPLRIECRPNPFRGRTVIRYPTNQTDHALLRVLDVSGREVICLAGAQRLPGECSIVWDGRARSGERVPAGMYLLRIEDGHGSGRGSGRLLLLR